MPGTVRKAQAALLDEMERQPVEFFSRRLFDRLDAPRASLCVFLGADFDGLVFVSNATTGVNTVLGSLRFEPGVPSSTTDVTTISVWVTACARFASADQGEAIRMPWPWPRSAPMTATRRET